MAGALIMLAVACAVLLSVGSLFWFVVSILFLVTALNRFYFPSRFSIDAEGITAHYPLRTQRFHWRDVQRFAVDDRGGWLSTRARRSWLDAYQGLHLLFGRDRETVIDRIRDHLHPEPQA